MNTVIKAENIGKCYNISHAQKEPYGSFRESLVNFFKSTGNRLLHPFSHQNREISNEKFWALKNISFEVQQGERLGIIGRNGAGKSTLLKVLSRVTEPTEGRISLKGKVASLLEIGTGFHPELTGKENIYMNGAILGMTKKEIDSKFDEIVEFAEIEKFLDTPVKRYSSGMYIRLAFAVAAHLEPEILVVDEVLAVGDINFQQKCIGKMQEVGRQGRTVLFVSHNFQAISQLCTRCLLIDKGNIVFDGPKHEAINKYSSSSGSSIYLSRKDMSHNSPFIRKLWIEDDDGNTISSISNGSPITVSAEIINPTDIPLELALSFYDELRRPLWTFTHSMHNLDTISPTLAVCSKVKFYPPKFTVSKLIVDVGVGPKQSHFHDHIMNCLMCAVIEQDENSFIEQYAEWPIYCKAEMNNSIIEV
jgi:lipopolysaccharide transport system ATP-binding protein